MIDDVTLWSKLESTWQVYSILSSLFHRWTIFKMLALKQSAEKSTFAPGEGVVRLLWPLATGLSNSGGVCVCCAPCTGDFVNSSHFLLLSGFQLLCLFTDTMCVCVCVCEVRCTIISYYMQYILFYYFIII